MTRERAYHTTTRVGQGGRVEFATPELAEGETIEVFVVAAAKEKVAPGSFLDLIDSFPAGPRSASTWEDVEANLQADRNAWDR